MTLDSVQTAESPAPNAFGGSHSPTRVHTPNMATPTTDADDLPVAQWRSALDGPTDRPFELFDARELPPPEPLAGTLERLAAMDDGAVLVQLNDREPTFLYPKLDDRGYEYDTAAMDEGVVTVVWSDAQS
jgi:hypothetical protein